MNLNIQLKAAMAAVFGLVGLCSPLSSNAGPVPPSGGPPAPILVGITVSGPSETTVGDAATLACVGTYSDNSTADLSPVWSVNSSAATIDAAGVLSAADIDGDLPVVATASLSGYEASHSIVIHPAAPVLESLSILGVESLEEGATAQYNCIAHYSDGSTAMVNPEWSDNSAVADITAAGALAAGSVSSDTVARITAAFDGLTASLDVTVTPMPPHLVSLVLVGPLSMDEEGGAQFECVGIYSDGGSAVVEPSWSDNSASATISASGYLTVGNISGDVVVLVSASLDGVTKSRAVTVRDVPAAMVGLEISGTASLPERSTAQLSCAALYSDGSRKTVNPVWFVNGPASVGDNGLLTAGDVTADQTVTVLAMHEGFSDALSVLIQYVEPTVTSITIDGPSYVMEETSASFECVAMYSDGTEASVAPAWSLESPFAVIDESGLLLAGDVAEDQQILLAAAFGSVVATNTVTVRYMAPAVVLERLVVVAPTNGVTEFESAELGCVAFYSDGSSREVAPTWSVDSATSTIDANGVLSVGNIDADGTIAVTASYGGVSSVEDVSVWMVGSQSVYPLSGFEGVTVRARLWDYDEERWSELGEMVGPEELVIEELQEGRWYWLVIEELAEDGASWNLAHAGWISM